MGYRHMSERITYGRSNSFGLVLVTLLTIVCLASLCVFTETALGQDTSDESIPEGVFSLINQANAADHLVSTIESDLRAVNTHPEATPAERNALKNILEIARVELSELEKSVTDTLSNFYNVDASRITTVRVSGKSWESIVAGLENGNLFNAPSPHDHTGTDGSKREDRDEGQPIIVAAENPTEEVLEPHSTHGNEDVSWGYGLDRYTSENGRNGNMNGYNGTSGDIGGAVGSGGSSDGGSSGNSGSVGGTGSTGGSGTGSGSGTGTGTSGNNGIGWGVGGTSNAGGNGNGNSNGNNNGNNGVGGGVGGGKDGNRGRGSK